jgi:copper(I)-binding protein
MVDMCKKTFAVLMLIISAGCLGIFGQPDIKVSYPKVVHSPMVENALSIFMFIENKGDGDDYLVSARINECPNSRVELHDVVNSKMVTVEKIKIPAGEVVELKGGSYHIMGFDITEPVDEVTIVLTFKKSGDIEVTASVPQEESKMEGMVH